MKSETQRSRLDGVQGGGEQQSKPYMKYGDRVAQLSTPQSTKSAGGATSPTSRQASAARVL